MADPPPKFGDFPTNRPSLCPCASIGRARHYCLDALESASDSRFRIKDRLSQVPAPHRISRTVCRRLTRRIDFKERQVFSKTAVKRSRLVTGNTKERSIASLPRLST